MGLAETNIDRCLRISRNIALATAILTTVTKQGIKHRETNDPNLNQPLDENRLNSFRNYWLNQDFESDNHVTKMEEIAICEHI